jgi:hypothetical protein
MSAELIIQLVTLAAKLIAGITDDIVKGKTVMSETDAKRIKAALAENQAATIAMRPVVDAALDAASKR